MKPNSLIILTTLATSISITGCQTSKNLLNGFTGGVIKTAALPTQSSSRIQFFIKDSGGTFIASPDSAHLKVNGKNQGVVASTRGIFDNLTFSKADNFNTTYSDLGLPKPNEQLDSKRGRNNVVERYVTPNQEIDIKYLINGSSGSRSTHCDISGRFTPKPNTDYRITGESDYKKCYILLEQFVKDSRGNVTTQPIRFK